MRALPLLVLAAACTGEPDPKDGDPTTGDDTGTTDGTVDVGDLFDMETTDEGVTATFEEPGTYVVILFSESVRQDTFYGYGDAAGTEAVTGEPDPLPEPHVPDAPAPSYAEVGDTRTFEVSDGSGYVTVEAEAVEVSDELVIWNDVTTVNPLGDIPSETLDGVTGMFEEIVLPRTRQVFGDESDVDGGGKIDALISFTVNDYGAVAYVTWCDIGTVAGCGTRSNGSEIIYMGIPEPDGNYGTDTAIVEIWAHELNHLVYAWHKYLSNGVTDRGENVYLTEGMSELAQDLTGFNNGNQYIWAAAIDMRDVYDDEDYSIQGVSLNDVLRGEGYYDAQRDGPLRGAGYLFLRYLFEQAGGFVVEDDGTLVDAGGMAFLHDWFDSPELGPDCVEATTGRDVLDVAMDFYTAIVVSGRGINDDPRHNFQPRVQDPLTGYEFGVDTYASIHGWLNLSGPPVQPIGEADGQIRAGGVEYLEVTITEPGETLTIPVDEEAKPRARAFRIE
ncbi:MAG: hypothetical protein ACOZNI_06820 [Myxococcota bacterium]